MRNGLLAVCLILVSIGALAQIGGPPLPWPAHNWQPPLPVPEVYAPPTGFSCRTVPNPQTLAVIGCTPVTFQGAFPAFVLPFLRVHEYGHVNQLRTNPNIYYSTYGEWDADCYAAANLVVTDPQLLSQTIWWLWNVVGPGFKDATHGSGYEVAQRALQCARSQDPNFMALGLPVVQRDLLASIPAFYTMLRLPQAKTSATQHRLEEQPIPPTTRRDDPDVTANAKGVPPFCTALDLLIDAAHSHFWEASTKTGAVRPTIDKALQSACEVTGSNRDQVTCRFDPNARSKVRVGIEGCLETKEWKRSCSDSACASESFVHPDDPEDHTKIELQATEVHVKATADVHVKR